MVKILRLILFSMILCWGTTLKADMLQTPDGAHLYYEVKGKGEPILLIHGWTMSHKFWSRQVADLARKYQVIVLDLRAHGNSSKVLHGHTIPQYAKDVRTLILKLKLRQVTLVGWSLAGPVVIEYYKQFGSDRLKALGLVDATPAPYSPAQWNSHSLKNYNFSKMNATLIWFQNDRKGFATRFIQNMFQLKKATPTEMAWMLEESLKTPTPIAVAIYSDYLSRDYTGVLKTIQLPTIVFSGNSDIFRTAINMGRYLSSQIKKSTFIPFENSGHLLFYEEPEKFNLALDLFIKKINR